jgi:hypothetical protein
VADGGGDQVVADGGGDQVQAGLVEAGDGVAEADGVAGEAGCHAHDALLPAGCGQVPAAQSIHAIGVLSLMQAAVSTWWMKSSRVEEGAVADEVRPEYGRKGP